MVTPRTETERVVFEVFFFQAEDGIRDVAVTGVQTCLFRSLGQRRERRATCGASRTTASLLAQLLEPLVAVLVRLAVAPRGLDPRVLLRRARTAAVDLRGRSGRGPGALRARPPRPPGAGFHPPAPAAPPAPLCAGV